MVEDDPVLLQKSSDHRHCLESSTDADACQDFAEIVHPTTFDIDDQDASRTWSCA